MTHLDSHRPSASLTTGFLSILITAAAGCTMAPPDEDTAAAADPADQANDDAPVTADKLGGQANLLGAFDIGVIPETRSCPANSEAITINMDDEDRRNANSRDGWLGAIISGGNTSFFFCRVDGQLFRPLTTQFNDTSNHYAVLKLGGSCPNNSLDFARGFDNEDDNNANSSSGNIAPNISNGNTTLRFCFFRSDSVTMGDFPDVGFPYGVFAAGDFSRARATGFVHTDDEDSSNANSYSADPAWAADAQRIITAGGNTTLNLAKVR